MGYVQNQRQENFGYAVAGSSKSDDRFLSFDSKFEMYMHMTQEVVGLLNQRKDEFDLALAAGSIVDFYKYIARSNPNIFGATRFWQVDERMVNADHTDSNQRSIKDNFLHDLDGYRDFISFDTSLLAGDCARSYGDRIESFFAQEGQFDLVLLGVGPDGHIGGIFPGTILDDVDFEGLVGNTQSFNFPPKDRISMSFRAILNSKRIIVCLSGSEKSEIFAKIQSSDCNLPAAKLLVHPYITFYFAK